MSLRVKWEWQSSGDKWKEYSPVWARQLQEAFTQGQPEHVISHKGHVYRISFSTMTQTNELTGKQRPVRMRQDDDLTPLPSTSSLRSGAPRSRSRSPPSGRPLPRPPAPLPVPTDRGATNLWQWLDEGHGWCTYDSAAMRAIRQAWAAGQPTVQFLKEGTVMDFSRPEDALYELDFSKMYQQNKGTGSRRPVRTLKPESVERAPTHRWRWEAADGSMHNFPGSINDWLCMLYDMRKGKGTYQFTIPQFGDEGLYISFSEMTMCTEGGMVHPVRRELIAAEEKHAAPPTDVVWQAADGTGGWMDLPSEDCALIEEALRNRAPSVKIAQGQYLVDLKRMVRINIQTGGTRSLNRLVQPLPKCTEQPTVPFEQGEASWPERTAAEAADLASYDALLQKHSSHHFTDASFPPTDASFYGLKGSGTQGFRTHTWKRFAEFSAASPGQPSWTFNRGKYEPNDIVQGHLGSCWFVSMLSVVAERPYLMQNLLPRPALQRCGAHVACFYVHGQLTPVTVDDYFPVMVPPYVGTIWSSRGRHNQMWVPIVEKAYAKLHGSYAALSGGEPQDALSDLTGAPCKVIPIPWKGDQLEKGLWGKLLKWHRRGHLFGSSCGRESNEVSSATFEKVGLVEGHAYSVLDFAEVAVGATTHQLVRLRNPYGRKEWNGDWSDSSPMWTQELRTKLRVTAQDDGVFWMPYHDFLTYFFQLVVCFVGHGPGYAHTTLHVHPTAKNPLAFSAVMVEFKVPPTGKAVGVSVEVRQTCKRGKGPQYQLHDLTGVVLRCDGAPVDSVVAGMALLDAKSAVALSMQRPFAPGIYRVLVCSLLGGSDATDVHPRSCSVRVTSTVPLPVRQPPMDVPSLRLGLHLLLDHGRELEWRPFKVLEKKTVMPGVRVVEFRSYCGRIMAVVNATSSPVWAQYNTVGSTHAHASRPNPQLTDIVPGKTRQIILMAGTARDATWSAAQMVSASKATDKETHDPPVAGTIHEPMPL